MSGNTPTTWITRTGGTSMPPESSTTCWTGNSRSAISPNARPPMSDRDLLFPVPQHFKDKAWLDEDGYRRAYERSLRDPEGFWAEQAKRLDWVQAPRRIREVSFGPK